jgi:hypothetical protein
MTANGREGMMCGTHTIPREGRTMVCGKNKPCNACNAGEEKPDKKKKSELKDEDLKGVVGGEGMSDGKI